jgi:ribosome maturation factor RimP
MEIKEKIADLITGLLSSEGFDLVEIKLARFGRQSRLQIFMDCDKGVSIDDCARISKMMEPMIDNAHLFLENNYILDVSSPGLDRPLIMARDFKRRVGENIELIFNDSDLAPVKGKLTSADDECVEISFKDGTERFALETVKLGKIIF